MNRSIWPLAAVLSMTLAACGSTAAPASPSASVAAVTSQAAQASLSAVASAPAAATSAAPSTAGWTRPTDVKPLPEAGIFKVVSETPSPGDKVPIFFMGAQG